jgi:drug/metabolite transporter (DMT)-like permease
MRRVDRWTAAAFVVAVVMLGSNWVGVRFSNRELPPFFGAALRFAIATAVLFATVAVRRTAFPRGRALWGAVLYGIGQYFGTFALLYWALVVVPAGMTSVIFATLPLWTLFIASAARYERLTVRAAVGALIAVGGLAVVFSSDLRRDLPLERVAAVLAAAFVGAATSVIVRAFPRTHPIATNAIGTLVGVPILLAASIVAGERWALPVTPPTWLALAYLVLSTCVAFALIVWLILQWSPSAAGYVTVLEPIVTVVLATILAAETFGLGLFVGGFIVGIGTYLGALAGTTRGAAHAAAPTPAK